MLATVPAVRVSHVEPDRTRFAAAHAKVLCLRTHERYGHCVNADNSPRIRLRLDRFDELTGGKGASLTQRAEATGSDPGNISRYRKGQQQPGPRFHRALPRSPRREVRGPVRVRAGVMTVREVPELMLTTREVAVAHEVRPHEGQGADRLRSHPVGEDRRPPPGAPERPREVRRQPAHVAAGPVNRDAPRGNRRASATSNQTCVGGLAQCHPRYRRQTHPATQPSTQPRASIYSTPISGLSPRRV
jgi:hypothetical protein